MAIILKDSYGNEETFDYNEIYFKDENGELVKYTQGNGGSTDVCYVTFMSHDGLIEYGKKAVAIGDDCANPITRGVFDTPTRESDVQYNYTFIGWATVVNGSTNSNWNKAVTEDKTVYASYTSTTRSYTITYYDSDGTTVLNTETLKYGSTPSYIPAKSGYDFDGWEQELVPVTGDASYVAKWTEEFDFATVSWARLAEISETGDAEKYCAIGNEKALTYSYGGTTYSTKARIIGFNHDSLSDGTGKAGITFAITDTGMKCPINKTEKTYNSQTGYYAGGWVSCDMRTTLNNDVLKTLPSDLQSVIKSVSKSCLFCPDGSKYLQRTSEDKLWIPSYTEIGLTFSETGYDDGVKYSGFEKRGSGYKEAYPVRTGKKVSGLYQTLGFNTSNGASYSFSGGITAPAVFCFCI